MTLFLGLFAAYFLGSIPFALLTVRLMTGVDIRTVGSGNVGATNAARAFERGRLAVFLLIYLLDFGKGFVATFYLTAVLGLESLGAQILIGAAAILGHCTSPFLGFRGGKGVATATGVFFVLAPVVLAVALVLFLVVFLTTGQVFLGSLVIGLTLAVGVIVEDPGAAFAERLPLTLFCALLAVFLFYTHRSNIRKYLARSQPA
jgi:glycerol-3-phosphate acyltransferase PlsY